jgi:dolichol-phosphate mannosyltransferase
MKLSVVIPAHNEREAIAATVTELHHRLTAASIDHEIVIINDHSTDGTEEVLQRLCVEVPGTRYLNSVYSPGFGLAVRYGLENFTGDAVAIFMADASDRPEDLIRFFQTMIRQNVDCIFGSRFTDGGGVVDYPLPKLILNRIANHGIRLLFNLPYNDVTNAFKLFRRHVIEGVKPILSHHFNLTIELPLKAIIRGYSYAIVPNHWINRKTGESKLKIKEMGSRYMFIVIYCFIEKWMGKWGRGAITPFFVRIVSVALIASACWNIFAYQKSVSNLPPRDRDDLVLQEQRFAEIRRILLQIGFSGNIAFVANQENESRYLHAQYVMVPWVLLRYSRDARFLLADFGKESPSETPEIPQGFSRIYDSGDGLLLFEKKP